MRLFETVIGIQMIKKCFLESCIYKVDKGECVTGKLSQSFSLFVCLFLFVNLFVCFCRDLTYGKIKHISFKDVRAYSNLEKL